MISSVTFETAALADAIKKADKVAPKKGTAFDKAAGIVFDFDPASAMPLAIVKATNLEISSMEWVTVAEWEGERATWRLPSFLLALTVGSLPIGTGKTVTLYSEESGHNFIVHLKSGRTKVKMHPIDMSYYPSWGAFEPDKMFPAQDLGGRLDQVEWAAHKQDARLNGVLLDGEHAIATDTVRLARVPLAIPDLTDPVVVPSGTLGSILRAKGDIQIGQQGSHLLIMPDDQTQLKAILMDVQYPDVSKLFAQPFDTEVKIQRDLMIEMIRRVDIFAQGERASSITMFIGRGEISFYMKNEGIGEIGDTMEVDGADHARFSIKYTSRNLLDALSKCPNNDVTMHYNEGATKGKVKFDGGSGYEVWVMSRTHTDA